MCVMHWLTWILGFLSALFCRDHESVPARSSEAWLLLLMLAVLETLTGV